MKPNRFNSYRVFLLSGTAILGVASLISTAGAEPSASYFGDNAVVVNPCQVAESTAGECTTSSKTALPAQGSGIIQNSLLNNSVDLIIGTRLATGAVTGSSDPVRGDFTLNPGLTLANEFNLNSLYIGYESGSNGNFINNAGRIVVRERMIVGLNGTGTYNVLGDGRTTVNGMDVGSDVGVVGTVNVNGTGITSTANDRNNLKVLAGDFNVGKRGTGYLNITSSAVATFAGNFNIGKEAGSRGEVVIDGVRTQLRDDGIFAETSAFLNVGVRGSGTVRVSNSARLEVSRGTTTFGSEATGQGGLVADSNSIAILNSLTLGRHGVGEVLASGRSIISTRGKFTLGAESSGVGSVTISDATLGNTSPDGIVVGSRGTGRITVTNSGFVRSLHVVRLGEFEDSKGYVNIVGSNDSSANRPMFEGFGQGIVIGLAGSGYWTVSGRAATQAPTVTIGAQTSGLGTLEISGEGAYFRSEESLIIGDEGHGTVTVSSGAILASNAITVARASTGTGIINIGSGENGSGSGLIGNVPFAANASPEPTIITGGAGDATLNFNHTDDHDFRSRLTGSLKINKIQDSLTTLYGENDYIGTTTVYAGTLRAGASNTLSSNSPHIITASGTLDLNGFSHELASLINEGSVIFGGKGGTTLSVAGQYTGNGGTFYMNTVLGGDDSVTDRLQFYSTTGNSLLQINNVGGRGALTVEGIRVVEVENKASDGKFNLHGNGL